MYSVFVPKVVKYVVKRDFELNFYFYKTP